MCTAEIKVRYLLKESVFAKIPWNTVPFLCISSKHRWPAKVEKITKGATISELILTNSEDRTWSLKAEGHYDESVLKTP